jgi:hypothetical protein
VTRGQKRSNPDHRVYAQTTSLDHVETGQALPP